MSKAPPPPPPSPTSRPPQPDDSSGGGLKDFLKLVLILLAVALGGLLVLSKCSGDGSTPFNYGGFNG